MVDSKISSLRQLIALLCICVTGFCDFSVEEAPFMTIHTPDSFLEHPHGTPIPAGNRVRYSTCPGIAWHVNDQFLITANYVSSFVSVFSVNPEERSYALCSRLDNKMGMRLGRAADVSLTKDGNLLAVGNSGDKLNIYRVKEVDSCEIASTPYALLGELPNQRMHGVAFSSDSKYLVYTTIDDPDQICIYRLYQDAKKKGPKFERTQHLQNLCHPLKPKSVAFSSDDRFVAICYSLRSSKTVTHLGRIAIYAFDAQLGKIHPHPISITEPGAYCGIISPENILFSKDNSTLLVTDQVLDRVTAHSVNPSTGQLGDAKVLLENPQAKLSFPHGIALSHDGKYLAVTNLGEDKINLYKVQ